MYKTLHPPEFIALQKEIAEHHKELSIELSREPRDIGEFFAIVATHCDVVLDGVYHPQELIELCSTLHGRLFQKRAVIVIS